VMLAVVRGTVLAVVGRTGSPLELMRQATLVAPEFGQLPEGGVAGSVGYFVIWATAVPVIPHIVMRVYTARDGRSAQRALNLAMLAYSAMILAAVLAIVPVGKLGFPGLEDADQIFLMVMRAEFPAVVRGVAVAAVLAAVMSTTDALLLACSSAVAHDLLGGLLGRRTSARAQAAIGVAAAWVIGGLALCGALSPPTLLTRFYTAGIGLLSAGLFVPTIAGLWWRRANRAGGVASLLAGAGTYVLALAGVLDLGMPSIVVALAASALAMGAGARLGAAESLEMQEQIASLHDEPALVEDRATAAEVQR